MPAKAGIHRAAPPGSPLPRERRRRVRREAIMPLYSVPSILPALPEILTVCAGMALLMVGVFRGEGSARLVSWLSVLAIIVVGAVAIAGEGGRQVGFHGLFVVDDFGVFMKI